MAGASDDTPFGIQSGSVWVYSRNQGMASLCVCSCCSWLFVLFMFSLNDRWSECLGVGSLPAGPGHPPDWILRSALLNLLFAVHSDCAALLTFLMVGNSVAYDAGTLVVGSPADGRNIWYSIFNVALFVAQHLSSYCTCAGPGLHTCSSRC